MLDLGWLGHISFNLQFFSGFLSIVIINIILSGDNAVVIALAVRSLPKNQRLWGMVLGSGLAVLLRIVLTFFAAKLMMIEFLKLGGGLLIAWIAVKLFTEGTEESSISEAGTIWGAVKVITVADLVMSLDNVLGVAGAARGNLFLLIFGLALSIPLIVGTATILSALMDRYPIIVYIGSAILGKVAGEMVIMDPFVQRTFHPSRPVEYIVMGIFVIGVLVAGRLLLKRKIAKQAAMLLENEQAQTT